MLRVEEISQPRERAHQLGIQMVRLRIDIITNK